MIIDRVTSGDDVPHNVNVIVEIPAHSDPVKYEVDKETGAMFVDRFMGTAMHYPANYGYIPHTLSEDGDPLEIDVQASRLTIDGRPHLRVENRVLPAGPTVLDEVANAAFFYGLMCALGEEHDDPTTILPQ